MYEEGVADNSAKQTLNAESINKTGVCESIFGDNDPSVFLMALLELRIRLFDFRIAVA